MTSENLLNRSVRDPGEFEPSPPELGSIREADISANALPDSKRELTELAEAATIGAAALAIAHDLGNCLNSMVLQASIIEMTVPEELKEKLAVIRAQGAQAANILRPLQRVRLSGKQAPYLVDINSIVSQIFEEMKGNQDQIVQKLSPGVVPLVSTRTLCMQLFSPLCIEFLRLAISLPGSLRLETLVRPEYKELTLTVARPEYDPSCLCEAGPLSDEFLQEVNEMERLSVLWLVKHHDLETQVQLDGSKCKKLIMRWK